MPEINPEKVRAALLDKFSSIVGPLVNTEQVDEAYWLAIESGVDAAIAAFNTSLRMGKLTLKPT